MYIDLIEAVLESQMIKLSELCNVYMCMCMSIFFLWNTITYDQDELILSSYETQAHFTDMSMSIFS